MNKTIMIWGRELSLKIVFDVFNGEEILSEQQSALDQFLTKSGELLSDSKAIEQYCIENSSAELSEPIDNIFRYVMPTTLFIKRNTDTRIVAVLCNFRFDDEYGCALIYENEVLKCICSQEDL